MVQIVAATFRDGVFEPDVPPALADAARVRLVIETINSQEFEQREESWAMLERLWKVQRLDSGGDRLTRDQLHERL